MVVVLAMMLQLLKLCIIGFFVAVQGSKGLVISPSPPNLPVYPSPSDSWTATAPSSPEVPNGSFLHPPIALPLPASAPTPQKHEDIEPYTSPSPSPITLSPPYEVVPSPSTVQGNVPSPLKASPPQRKEPAIGPPISTQTAPAPAAIPSGRSVNNSPVSQPTEHGTLAPNIENRNASQSHTAEPVLPSPVATPSTDSPKNSSGRQPTEHGSLPTKEGANKGHSPEPITPAPVALNLPKLSPVSQPTEHGSLPPIAHQGNANTSHNLKPVSPESAASPPWKVEYNPPVAHPIFPTITPSILPAPVTPPTSSFPANSPLVHPSVPSVSPSKLPAHVASPMSTPSGSFPWKKGGAPPVAAPLYKTPKPLPAVIHTPAQAPAAQKARQSDHAPEPLMSPKSPSNNEYHFPAFSPSLSSYNHHHTRNTITSPAPASPYMVSPPTSSNQDQATPSLPPASGQKYYVPPPMNQGSSVPPSPSPIDSPMGKVSAAPSPSIKIAPHPTEMQVPFSPPKASPSGAKTPLLPQVQALPPPPPNEECLSTVCIEPYTNSPPGAPCRCVWPMRVGLCLSVSLYTFFPLVSELASEIATGVFMKKSQVRIMGANAANEQPEKTVVFIDLVPLGENFDGTTAFFISDRFWHKKVVIKASYFGDYDVLYVSYPGLPPSPPLPPSTITMIDGGPYSVGGNNGGTIKPLGVDIQKRQHKAGLNRGIVAIIAVSVFLALVLCATASWVLFKFRDHVSQPASTPRISQPSLTKAPVGAAGSSLTGGGVGSASTSFRSSIAAYTGSAKTFSANDIEKATDNFHASRILGEGGFGLVYSGILEDGKKVAVKVLKREDHHGDREFLAEVEMLSRLHHRNLVKLIGICAEESFRCLVYELIPNGSVESHLHGVDRENSPLDWSARMKIALGAARGLAYLHEDSSPRVIHRDFKSSNILLEDDFTPKVSDFGLARTATDEDNKHISTRVMGTFGYVAPEYAMTGHLLVKSDVYSYGVVLLELLTGRKPVDMSQPPGQENLVAWARPLLTSKEGLEAIIDPSLGSDVPFDSVAKVAAIASMCVQPEVSNRPFMGEVVQALKLVCNECDEAKEEAGSRSSTQEGLSVDLDVGVSNVCGELPDNFQSQFSATNFDSGLDVERGLSASELFSSSARFGRQESGSFRRHSYSGPLITGRSRQLWQIMRRLSGGTVSEHETMFKL